MLFLDADYVKRNEKYFLAFDPLATITYNRGVITLIGDEMWRVQQVASRTSSRIGEAGLNILNMDAQEETSRIIIVVEDSDDNIRKLALRVYTCSAMLGLFLDLYLELVRRFPQHAITMILVTSI
jgi:aspartate kinase